MLSIFYLNRKIYYELLNILGLWIIDMMVQLFLDVRQQRISIWSFSLRNVHKKTR